VQIPARGLPSPRIPLAPGAAPATPQVGMDAAGNAIFVWQWPHLIQGMRMLPGGVPTTAVDLSSAGVESTPMIAVSGTGNAIAVWQATHPTDQVLQASVAIAQNAIAAPVPSDRHIWVASIVLLLAGAVAIRRAERRATLRP